MKLITLYAHYLNQIFMKNSLLVLFVLCIFSNVAYSQLTVNGNNDACMPFTRSFWIGNVNDNGDRIRIHHNNEAFIDFYPKLILRNFTSYSASNYNWVFAKYNNDPLLYTECANWGVIGTEESPLWRIYTNNLYVNGVWVTSDEGAKVNIRKKEKCLEKIKQVKGVTYDYKYDDYPNKSLEGSDTLNLTEQDVLWQKRNEKLKESGKNKIGFIAQDLMKVFPELVSRDSETSQYKVDYIGMIPVLSNAINEQQKLIEQQQLMIEELKKEISKLKKKE